MNFPIYTIALASGTLHYGYKQIYRKWGFHYNNFVQIIDCHGSEQGHKVARIIAGSIKRSGLMIDGMARSNIQTVLG